MSPLKDSNYEENTQLIDWITSRIPTFEKEVDKVVRTTQVRTWTRYCLLCSTIMICILLPLRNYLILTERFFSISHRLKHHILGRQSLLHKSRLYHNRSFRICLFWFATLCFFTFYNTQQDLLQITKRMGRIAVAMMPPLLFLSLRPSPLPKTLYLSLLPIHKWISRIVVLESLLHTGFYLLYMQKKNSLQKLKKLPNIYGIIAMLLFIAIGATSINPVRRCNFRLFYYIHYSFTWMTVILLHFHARPGIPYYTAMNCIILSYQIYYRVSHTRQTVVTTYPVSPSLTLLEFPLSDLTNKPTLPSAHVRLNICHKNFIKRIFFKIIPFQHPFTIATLPTDETIKLIIRNGQLPLRTNKSYDVTGAFDPELNFIEQPTKPSNLTNSLLETYSNYNPFQVNSTSLLTSPLHYIIHAKRVLIFVGGSAISFGLPLLRILNFNGVVVRLIWVSRDYRDLKLLSYFKNNFQGMEIYISGCIGKEQDIQIDYVDFDQPSRENVCDISENTFHPCQRICAEQTLHSDETKPITKGRSCKYGSIKKCSTSTNLTNMAESKEIDEIDFTSMFGSGKKKSKSVVNVSELESGLTLRNEDPFRKPITINPPPCDFKPYNKLQTNMESPNNMKVKVPSGVKVYFGRPTLCETDYEWCLERDCSADVQDDAGCQTNYESNEIEDLSNVWVVAAGPAGLVESTRRWTNDLGLHFHAENYAV
ncbi:putative ferric-chelate reductase NDAI_0C03140 [Naumovozyma dairenensis CBS 421]|uniref:Ferric oxidoreductase domain-containing protein n=1 Tax=Naumovozyma dairenensis (strain ATCC 10597 / BCRC 20456 / CBS 421 / NBRC 0211 / NRRL Y-12639) TaxID=1071378 RepID=G0W863_NAUDC|nr:hypothetical protein NDAI_0C03140 [Naumovozyma dairenensis CBS 421]CCD23974.1 hypothetical protein NDAI_0C03140 [Naumovozyma dairenensis CBS 421]